MQNTPRIVSRAEWREARQRLLAEEKEFTKLRDRLSRERRELPWVRVEKPYRFIGPSGALALSDLFAGKSQLLVYHFMFGPDDAQGCKSCSFWADGYSPMVPHLNQRDVAFAAISRAPLERLQAYAKRLGWTFPWVSSGETDFNFDFGVSFDPAVIAQGVEYNYVKTSEVTQDMPGVSVFHRDASGAIFHTYSCFGRGIDILNTTYNFLDLVPKGRDETGLPYTMSWVKRHDEYVR